MEPTTIACPCPPKAGAPRHPKGDTVTFREKMPFQAVRSMRMEIGQLANGGANVADIFGTMTASYIVHGIESWSLTDEKDEPLAVNRKNVETYILDRYEIATELGDIADGLYTEAVIVPLIQGGSESSRTSPTDGSTSARSTDSIPSSTTPPPSKRSSTSITPTEGIETISPLRGGDSNSSPNRVSAA